MSTPAESPSPARPEPGGFTSGPALVAYLAAFKFLVHWATAGLYGFFIDELYFLACGEHLAWGYVDMPPLTAFQAWLTRGLFGDSPLSIRLFPSLAGAGLVVMTGALAREMGGRRFAQALAALCVVFAPIYLAFNAYLSMNSVEPLAWMGCALLLVRMVKTGDVRLWGPFGVVAGLGLLNKQTMALFGLSLVAGLLLTSGRRLMANRWFFLGGAAAGLIVLPNLVWMVQHHFPHLELLANIRREGRDVAVGPLQFAKFEVLLMNPAACPVWLLGLWSLLAPRGERPFRALGWAYLITAALLLATTPGSHKTYYLAPAYPMLLASGAVALEARLGRAWVGPAYAIVVAAVGALLAPTFFPLLPPETYLRYTAALGISQPKIENRATSALPQLFADRFGWPEMAEAVARAYRALPPAERARTAIFANDYGQGGAIDFYGGKLGLPKAIGGHLTYWYWGPRAYTGESVIVLGDRAEVLEEKFESVRAVATVGHPYAMKQEHFTVFLCRRPRGWTFPSAWPDLKRFD